MRHIAVTAIIRSSSWWKEKCEIFHDLFTWITFSLDKRVRCTIQQISYHSMIHSTHTRERWKGRKSEEQQHRRASCIIFIMMMFLSHKIYTMMEGLLLCVCVCLYFICDCHSSHSHHSLVFIFLSFLLLVVIVIMCADRCSRTSECMATINESTRATTSHLPSSTDILRTKI